MLTWNDQAFLIILHWPGLIFYSICCLTLSNKHHAQLMLMLCCNGNNVESVSTECDWWPGDGQTQPSFPEPDHRHSVPWQATPAQRHCKSGLNITLHSARKRITMSYTWIMWFLLENVLWFCPPLRTSPYYVFIRIRGLQFWHVCSYCAEYTIFGEGTN